MSSFSKDQQQLRAILAMKEDLENTRAREHELKKRLEVGEAHTVALESKVQGLMTELNFLRSTECLVSTSSVKDAPDSTQNVNGYSIENKDSNTPSGRLEREVSALKETLKKKLRPRLTAEAE